MLGITDFYAYVFGVVGVILLPGPNSMYVLSVATSRGTKPAYLGAAGVFLGDMILMLLSVFGVASLLQAFPFLFKLLRWAGAAYLFYMAIRLILIGFQSLQKGKKKMGDAQPSAEHPFYRAFFISLLNPKAIFFFMSFFIQFVDANYPHPWLSFLVLGIVLQMISMLYLSGLILFGRKLTKANQKNPWLKVGLMWAVGLLFSGFSVRLVLEDLHS